MTRYEKAVGMPVESDRDVHGEQVMIDQFYELCDGALVAALHGSDRAQKLLAAARRLAVWFPGWLAADLEVASYLDRLGQAIDRLTRGSGLPAA